MVGNAKPGLLSSKKYSRLVVFLLGAAASACTGSKATPATKELVFGAHRVQVEVPAGWEALDQGNQKRFRKGEFEIVLQNLGPRTPPPRNLDELIDWGLEQVGHNQRREEKSRRAVMLDGREGMDIETWHRLDHSNPQRIFLVEDDGDLLALHTVGMAFEESLVAFGAIRNSLHLVNK
jgi:hypothetical protein